MSLDNSAAHQSGWFYENHHYRHRRRFNLDGHRESHHVFPHRAGLCCQIAESCKGPDCNCGGALLRVPIPLVHFGLSHTDNAVRRGHSADGHCKDTVDRGYGAVENVKMVFGRHRRRAVDSVCRCHFNESISVAVSLIVEAALDAIALLLSRGSAQTGL